MRLKLFQFNSGDGVHDALAEPRVKILVARLQIGFGKIYRLAHDNGNWMKMEPPAARESFVRAEDPDRHDGRERSCDNQSKSGQRRLQPAIERAFALRKNERAFAAL